MSIDAIVINNIRQLFASLELARKNTLAYFAADLVMMKKKKSFETLTFAV